MAELFDMKELEERVILVAVSTSDEEEWQDQFHGTGTGRVKKSERYKGIH